MENEKADTVEALAKAKAAREVAATAFTMAVEEEEEARAYWAAEKARAEEAYKAAVLGEGEAWMAAEVAARVAARAEGEADKVEEEDK